MKVVVFTLGCKVNGSESDSLARGLTLRGYEVSEKLENADIYIVNTCAVTAEAEKKSRQVVARIRKINPEARMIFTGCAVQKNPEAFKSKLSINLITGTFNKGEILDMLDKSGEHIAPETKVFEELLPAYKARTRSYIKVQDGCDNFCSYCIVPFLRGRSRSRKVDSVIDEIVQLKPAEAVLNGINLSAYNDSGITLAGLIDRLKNIDVRIRLGSLEALVITEELMINLGNLKNFAEHFHLSLQSGSTAVLKTMNRKYTAEEYKKKCEIIRKFFPNSAITTDIIVGFPTETEADFLETLALVKEVNFSDIHCFSYSPRSGTVAYKLKDLPPDVKKERLERLMDVKKACKKSFFDSNIGKFAELIGEEFIDGYTVGYTGNYIRARVKGNFVDKKVKIKLLKSLDDEMIGELL